MDFTLRYNDELIEDKSDMDFATVVMYDRLGGTLDNMLIQLSVKGDSSALSGIAKNDTIQITTKGFDSGKMYVSSYQRDRNNLVINAISTSTRNREKKSKIWRNVRLSEIMYDVAKNYGFTLKTYGITDRIYQSVSQINETDLAMLNRICIREGYIIKIDNDCLIVFNEYDLEHGDTTLTVQNGDENISSIGFSYSDKSARSVTVSYYDKAKGLITYTSTDENMDGSKIRKNEYVSSLSEAQRFSKGYLRNINKTHKTGYLRTIYNPDISGGTLLEVVGYGEFEGRYIAYEVAHDVIQEVTKIKMRSVLNY